MRPVWLAFLIIVIDQITKTLVRANMRSGQSIPLIGDWLKLTFTENPGMAFGIELGSPLLVTTFAILATILIVLYLRVVKTDSVGYHIGLALILGGAIGNIIDRIFNAVIYDYGGFLYGQVIDFIHVDVWSGRLLDSIPLIGGAHISLFPIWNVADMAIVVGVTMVIIFQQLVQSEELSETPATEPVQS